MHDRLLPHVEPVTRDLCSGALYLAKYIGGRFTLTEFEYALEGTRLVALYDPANPDHLLGVKVNGKQNLCWNGRQSDV